MGEKPGKHKVGSMSEPELNTPEKPSSTIKQHGDPGGRSLFSPAILALAVVGFIIGTTEFIAVGVVPQIAHHLHTSTSAAGMVASFYATGTAVATIPMAFSLMHVRPRALIPGTMLFYAAAHGIMATAPTLPVLLGARLVAATVHSLALGAAGAAAGELASPNQRASAVAMVLGGLSTGTFAGAPLGTLLADLAGWRWSFAVIGVFAAAVGLALLLLLPDLPRQRRVSTDAIRSLFHPAAMRPLVVMLGSTLANSVLFTYLGSYLMEVTGFNADGVALGLALFGLAALLGNIVGGRVARYSPNLGAVMFTWCAALALLAFGAVARETVPALMIIAFWAVAFQTVVLIVTHQATEASGTFGGTLASGTANAGIAVGGLLAGIVLGSLPVTTLPWLAGVLMAFAAVPYFGFVVRRRRYHSS
jgi:DHA1 family inner membrane transport protein